MSKVFCKNCIYRKRIHGWYHDYFECTHSSNTSTITNYNTGILIKKYHQSCEEKNSFGHCHDYVEKKTLTRKIKKFFSNSFKRIKI